MSTALPTQDIEDLRKQLAALHRAVPVTRMVDYGVALGDALEVHASAAADEPPAWEQICARVAQRRERLAEASESLGHRLTAAQAWREAAALLICAQLAFNEDRPSKRALYEQAQAAMLRHSALCSDLEACQLRCDAGDLHAWIVRPTLQPASAAVVVLGGLSGWGAAYLDMGRALAARGMVAILAEGPGQGLTRMRSGLHLDRRSLRCFSHFVDHAQSLGAQAIGVWGNSFGGLLAAQLAVTDERVRAACVNGAPMVPTVPDFRTAREQMQAAFGTCDPAQLALRVESLALDAGQHRTQAAMLVVEGGRDPLVPLGSQASFLDLTASPTKTMLSWSDGEHTLYNRAGERNARVSDWFARQLGCSVL